MQDPEQSARPETDRRGRLLRILGVGFGIAVIIGNTIAAGILRTPGDVAHELPNAWLYIAVWVVGGLYALLGALSIAELGTMIPRSGGQFVFARHALGDYAGFIVGWSDWLSTCGTTAAVSVVIGEYSGVLFPKVSGQAGTVVIAIAVTVVFAVLQWRGIRAGSSIQNVTSLLKALLFVALVAACFALGGKADVAPGAVRAVPGGAALMVAIVLSLQSVIYTYDGWTGVIYFSEEVRDPARSIPRAMFGGVLSVIAIYLLVNLALVYVLPISRIDGQKLAAGVAATEIFVRHGDAVFRSIMILALLSGINAYHLMASRVLFAMSRDGLFSKAAARVNKGGTPTVALLMSTAIAVLFIIGGGLEAGGSELQPEGAENAHGIFKTIIAMLAFFFVVNYLMSFISVFVLRRREPEKPRPYRAWGYPWTTGLVLIGSVAFLFGAYKSDPTPTKYALVLLAASYPVFRLMKLGLKAQHK